MILDCSLNIPDEIFGAQVARPGMERVKCLTYSNDSQDSDILNGKHNHDIYLHVPTYNLRTRDELSNSDWEWLILAWK